MPEKLLITIHITEFHALNRRPDANARAGMLDSLWRDFPNRDIGCFHCGEPVVFPAGRTDCVPAPDNMQQILCVPLCKECGSASTGERWEQTKALIERFYADASSEYRIEPAKRSLLKPKIPPSSIPVNKRWHLHDAHYKSKKVKA